MYKDENGRQYLIATNAPKAIGHLLKEYQSPWGYRVYPDTPEEVIESTNYPGTTRETTEYVFRCEGLLVSLKTLSGHNDSAETVYMDLEAAK